MKRYAVAILAFILFTGCASYNGANQTTPGTGTTNPVTLPTTTSTVISKLELGKTYRFSTVDIIFQNLYRSKDKSGAAGLLLEYTMKYRQETPQAIMSEVEMEVLQGELPIKRGGISPGHELVNYQDPEMMPGGTLQKLVFFEALPDQDLKINLKGADGDTTEYHLSSAYPTEMANFKDLEKMLLIERLQLNEDYTKTVAPKEDLTLVGRPVQFKLAEFKLTDVKFVVNEIIYGRDLIITYQYKPTAAATKTDLNIKIQAFQYGVELARQSIAQDPIETPTGYQEADFIVNYKLDGAIIIRISDPDQADQLVFIPNDKWHSLVSP